MFSTSLGFNCQGVEVQLDQDHLAFGGAVQRCKARKRIVMMNTGDIGARFRVLIEILKPDRPDAAVSLKGPEYIGVPALAKRDYKMSFFTYREGQYNTKVTFRNVVSGKYLFYLVTFKATSPGVQSTIELETAVRRTTSAAVQVENPLTAATCLTTECKCPDISVPPQHTVPGQSKGFLSFEYQPLCAGETTARLTLCSNDLCFFHYDLLLRALPPPPEKTIHFNTSLGSSHSVLVKFINYSRIKTEYSCKAPPGGSPGPWCGKLTVSSQRSEGHSKPCSWVYYLKGYRPESS